MKIFSSNLIQLSCLLFVVVSCSHQDTQPDMLPQAGGETTTSNRSSTAFTEPAPNLLSDSLDHHLDGDVAFEATFVSAPAAVNPGLGPLFNNTSCASCHIRNGRGLAVTGNNSLGSQLLVRVSLPSPNNPSRTMPVPGLGRQLQDHAIFGSTPEATVELTWVEREGSYEDGTTYNLRYPHVTVTLADGTLLPGHIQTSLRIPPPIFGLGLLEAISEETILQHADPNDENNDGISGRPNRIVMPDTNESVLGRFSWKANSPTLIEQTASAYVSDMGITNPLRRDRDPSRTDIDETTLTAAAFYTQTLAVPRRTNRHDTQQGEMLFETIGCASCHIPSLKTGTHPIAALANQTIYPYTDLLLHDMGKGLEDKRPDFEATGREWRTSPLWGIGLTNTVLPNATFLHDGRARTLEEAILWHEGEAQESNDKFKQLSKTDRLALIQFLRSL